MSEKKHKDGYELLKEKYNALQKEKEILVQTAQENYCRVEKERDEWKAKYEHVRNATLIDNGANAKISELQTIIDQQSSKISQLTADLKVVQGNLEATNREHERQLNAMYAHMGWFKRMTWDWHHAPIFKEDERWNETH